MARADRRASPHAGDFWAITSYFNPLSYKSRLANYRIFRERLSVPLVAVELAFGRDFELGPADAEILIQVRGGDVLWQKDRLLNIALTALPGDCKKVAWLDCDVLFGRPDWADQASFVLDDVLIVQLFNQVHYLPRHVENGLLNGGFARERRISLPYAVACGFSPEDCMEQANGPDVNKFSSGIAWAARRELLSHHGFYDACIIGGGDRAMVTALYGCFQHLVRRQRLNERQFAHFLRWAEPLNSAVAGAVSSIEGDLFHLWHGDLENRRWYRRYIPMPDFSFDPVEDIALTENELWRWSSDKPDLHAYVHNHFVRRREDG